MTEENNPVSPKRAVKPRRAIATAILIAVAIASAVFIALALTVFRPRDPTFAVCLIGMRTVNLADLLVSNNLTRAVVIEIDNRNYGSATWRNFTVLIKMADDTYYNGRLGGPIVGEVPIPEGTVLQRSSTSITTFVTLRLDRVRQDYSKDALRFLGHAGLNFTCSVTAVAKVRPFGVFPPVRGSISVDCFGSFFLLKHLYAPNSGLFGGHAWCRTVKKKITMY